MSNDIWVGLDIDSTVITHCYPGMDGKDIGAIPWLLHCEHKFKVKYLIHSMRSGESAEIAKAWLETKGLTIHGINKQPGQEKWTDSPKCYAHLYVDDRGVGTPLRNDGCIDWQRFGPMVCSAVEKLWLERQPMWLQEEDM